MVQGEGMPQTGIPTRRGNLYIKFNVDFPDIPFLKPEELDTVAKSLHQQPRKKTADAPASSGSLSVVQLIDTTKENFNFEPIDDGSSQSSRQQQQQRDSRRGGAGPFGRGEDGPQGAQCQQM